MKCDGNNDCGDHSDEIDCIKSESEVDIVCGDGDDSKSKKFQCSSNKTICLDIEARCNGTAECPRGEDEVNCTSCSIHEFQCANEECIRLEWRCDGEKDCEDASDEKDCENKATSVISELQKLQYKCTADKFNCKDGTCVEWDKVCDSVYDCPNQMDENGLCKNINHILLIFLFFNHKMKFFD